MAKSKRPDRRVSHPTKRTTVWAGPTARPRKVTFDSPLAAQAFLVHRKLHRAMG